MKHVLDKIEKEKIAQEIAAIILKSCPGLVAVYLFGSFVTEEPFSDIDIGILMEGPEAELLDTELKLETELEKNIPYPVDVRMMNGAPVPFARNVIGEGIVILDKHKNDRADFEALTLKKYFDFSHFRKRYLEDIANAPL